MKQFKTISETELIKFAIAGIRSKINEMPDSLKTDDNANFTKAVDQILELAYYFMEIEP